MTQIAVEPVTASAAPTRIARGVAGLPTRVSVVFLWVCLVVQATLLVGAFTPWVAVPVILLVVALTWRLIPAPPVPDRATVAGSASALGLATAWALANLPYTGQVLLVQRDPGFLTLMGLWLRGHADPDIPMRTAVQVAARLPGSSLVDDAFWQSGDHIYAQGAKLVPGLAAMVGWAGGEPGVRAANLLIAALALLAVYDVARRLTNPWWGLLPMAALALTTPFVYFSRTLFTEPATMVLMFGGLAVLWTAVHGGPTWQWALGGTMVGGGALARIDGASAAVGLVLALGVVVAGTRDPLRRPARIRGALAASGAAAAMVLVGFLEVRLNSPGYLAEHRHLYLPLLAMLVATAVLVGAGLALLRWTRLDDWLTTRRGALGTLGAGLVVLGSLVLASRPLWMQPHGIEPGSGLASFIGAFQRASGVLVDPTRSYDEQTVTWIAWYLGAGAVVLGVVGAALLARAAVARGRAEIALLLVTLGAPALLYVLRPSITPDQIWAMRRFLPAALPAVLLCAGWAVHALWSARPAGGVGAVAVRVSTVLAAAVVLLPPTGTWGGIMITAEYEGRSAQIEQLCSALAGRHVVTVRGIDPPLLPTIRIACDADVIQIPAPATQEELAAVHEAWGSGELIVVAMSQTSIDWPADEPATISSRIGRWPYSVTPRRAPMSYIDSFWIGTVAADGTITPVPPPSG